MADRTAKSTTPKKSVARKLTVVKPAEVVETKADTIDEAAEKPKTVAGKQQILDTEKVKQIIALSDEGKKPHELAEQFGVAASHISNIVRGVTWSHVTGRYYQGRGKHWESHPAKDKKGGK